MARGLSLIVFLFVSLVSAANASPISTQTVGLEDGLSQSTVTAIAEGPAGFLWIGTPDGLHRYDGYEFRVYHDGDAGLADDDITALAPTRDGSLSVATRHAGLFSYRSGTRRFTLELSAEELSGARITCLSLDQAGMLWIGTDSAGVFRHDATTRATQRWPHDPLSSRSLSSPRVTAIATDRWGNVIVGTSDRGLNVISAATGSVSVYRSLVGIPDSLPSDRISALLVTRDNRLLVGTARGGAGWFDTETGRFTAMPIARAAEDGEPGSDGARTSGPVGALLESRDGDIWIATSGTVTRLREGESVAVERARRVDTVYEDASGVIWFGARAGGLSRYVPRTEQFSRYLGGPGSIGELVWSFAEATDGLVWIGTDDGLFRLGPTAPEPERVATPALESFPVHDLFSAGDLWLALGPGGAAQINLDGELLRRIGATPGASPAVLSVHADESRVYLGTAGDGLHVIDAGDSRRRYPTDEPGLARGGSVYAIESAPDGRLWLGTDDSAMLRFDPQSGAIERWPLIDEAGPGVIVWGIEPTREGSLWLAAREGGAILFHPADGVKLRLVPRIDLPADIVYDVIVDGLGGVWITTNKGLFRLDEATGETQRYTRADGVAADEFSSGAAMAASDGLVYAGGVNGFTRFDPRRVRPSLYLPPIAITHLTDSRGREIAPTGAMLPRGENGFSLTFSSLDFADPAANRYSYRLVDYDDEWRSPDVDRTIRYAGLPQGDYRLYLRGSNGDGIWNYEGATLDITVLPRFWQTNLFVVGMMALAIVLVSFGVYRRLANANDERTELEHVVAQRTSDLEASKRAMERAIAARGRVEQSLRDARDELENRVATRTDALLREVQERKEAQERTDRALRENEALLQEIHHRVKNNMQVISSLLHLQAAQVAEGSSRHGFEVARQRINAMALIHERLYQTRDFSSVSMREYFDSLVSSLASLHGRAFSVETRVEAAPLDITSATPCGLIANELVTNAMKHAFVDVDPTEPRSIRIEFVDEGEAHRLTVADNGGGLREGGGDSSSSTSLGLRIVDVLADQLDGVLTIASGEQTRFGRGSEFTVRF